ncbi:MAG TPA: BamA/TamA family outer membrane protein [Burkholderiaceae bacterium]|nr:BamA/TamA family outer membrane protein [Burkholderiaceae bacterium]HQR69197.1 BamA/TamA family outer membrane protein [Burkholderiaceae bacterium]
MRPALLALLVILVGLPAGAAEQSPVETDEGVRLVTPAGVSGKVATALEEVLARFRLPEDADEADEERELRRAERAAVEALATEGYFSPRVRFEPNTAKVPRYRMVVDPGPPTRVATVEIQFTGALAEADHAARAAELRRDWALPVGAVFRSADWETAKNRLMLAVTARDYAGATLGLTTADIDAETATARLRVEVDSGPAYRFGPLKVEGLERLDAALVERYNTLRPGAPFDRTLMLQFQQALQESPHFSSVVVTFDLEHAEGDAAPVRVQLREAKARRFAAGVGFATNTGAHIEALYRQSIIFGLPYSLQSGFRVDQTGQFAYADVIFPPQPGGARNSVGVLFENSDIENLRVNRWGIGAARSKLTGPRDGHNVETQLAINFEHERRETPLDPPITLDVLSTSYTWTRRDVDDITNPRRGNLIQLQGSVGLGGFAVEDAFVRGFGSIVQYFPVGARDVLILRGQLGGVQAESTNAVPNKFLFRTGGALTVRGYDFESLGVEQGGAIVGGRALAVGSVEYVKWLPQWDGNWGIAAFVDAGDAAARFSDLSPALGYGLGARWRTPAGPLAVDVAWGERFQQLRVHFSVAIAF